MVTVSTSKLTTYLETVRPQIDQALSSYLDLPSGCPDELRRAMRYSLLAPGKRLRPVLVLMAAEVCGGSLQEVLSAACAVEMIHAYSLIHDDLPAMDDDDMRRGQPTCHKKFDEPTAILAGDGLLTLAFEVIARDIQPPAAAARCCQLLAQAAGACGMVGGQADDLRLQFSDGTVETLKSIHRRKTGALITVCLQLAAEITDVSEAQTAALLDYGNNLGLAFQIIDDLLDVNGCQHDLGKQVGKDSEHGKLTFPSILGDEESLKVAEQLIQNSCSALKLFDTDTATMEALARYVLERNH